ncbi:MAG: acetate--CoA ligase family protein [Actinobacteria bacterium]|nr:acetate--CoA ligase family protein [Actinomycetota bacterium]
MKVDLAPLLRPRSVAVVGANDRPGSYGDVILRNLAAAGFEGAIWGVNPKREEVHGRPCVASVAELPEPVDAVVVAIPAAACAPVIVEAGERGCGGAIVIAAGFGETAAGRPLEAELLEAAARTGLPVCGPNGNGVVSVAARAPLWGDSVERLTPGPVAVITQSGNFGVNALGSDRGVGFHTVVSTGNGAVLEPGDWLEALAATEGVGSIALMLESDGDGGRLTSALALCAERRVAVAVLKVGSSEGGARAAGAHTGALAGDQRVFAALLKEAGAAIAREPSELLELARALAVPDARPRRRGGLAILTCSGGDSGVAADLAEERGLELPDLSPGTRERLAEILPSAATVANPLDYTSMLWDDHEALAEIGAAVSSDPGIDQLLLLFDQPRGLDPEIAAGWERVKRALLAGAARGDAATILGSTLPELLDPDGAAELGAAGVATAAGLGAAIACAAALRTPAADPKRLRAIALAAAGAGGEPGDAEDLPAAGGLGEVVVKGLLAAGGLGVPSGAIAVDVAGAVKAARELGTPVALKLSSPALIHKSEAGALALDLRDQAEVREAAARLLALPEAADATLLVERMAGDGVELIFAVRRDGAVPALLVGLGGIWAEALDDVAVVPLPASADRVERALRSLRAAPLLTGGRGRPAVDLGAAASFGSRLGELAVEHGLDLLEVNPALASPGGCVALDAVARRA